MNPTADIVDVDSRNRITLGPNSAERYLVDRDPHGVIVLTPAVVLSQEEYRLLNRPDILDAVADSRARSAGGEAGAGKPTRRVNP